MPFLPRASTTLPDGGSRTGRFAARGEKHAGTSPLRPALYARTRWAARAGGARCHRLSPRGLGWAPGWPGWALSASSSRSAGTWPSPDLPARPVRPGRRATTWVTSGSGGSRRPAPWPLFVMLAAVTAWTRWWPLPAGQAAGGRAADATYSSNGSTSMARLHARSRRRPVRSPPVAAGQQSLVRPAADPRQHCSRPAARARCAGGPGQTLLLSAASPWPATRPPRLIARPCPGSETAPRPLIGAALAMVRPSRRTARTARSPAPATRRPRPGARSPAPWVRHLEPGPRNRAPGTGAQEPGLRPGRCPCGTARRHPRRRWPARSRRWPPRTAGRRRRAAARARAG